MMNTGKEHLFGAFLGGFRKVQCPPDFQERAPALPDLVSGPASLRSTGDQ